MSKKSEKEAVRANARTELLKLLKPGQTVYTVLRHVSSSGMFRVIDVVIAYDRVDRITLDADKAGKALKVGAEAYGTTGDNAYRTGTVACIVIGQSVTIRYGAAAHAEAGEETFPLKDARVYAKSKRIPAVRSIGYLAAQAMGDSWDRDRQGIKVGGCGMDMGFHVVYSLGSVLWPKGTPKPHSTRNGEPDRAGGYALKHSWL